MKDDSQCHLCHRTRYRPEQGLSVDSDVKKLRKNNATEVGRGVAFVDVDVHTFFLNSMAVDVSRVSSVARRRVGLLIRGT